MAKQTSPRTSSTPTKRKAQSEAPPPITKVVAKAPSSVPQAAPAPKAAPSVAASHDQIAARAFELFRTRANSEGSELSDWLRAERELASR
jgi:hypothetical protein